MPSKCRECGQRGEFGFTKGSPKFCAKHRDPHMINLSVPQCKGPNCKTQPSFAENKTQRPIACFAHKTAEMIDVVSKRCGHPFCNNVARFPSERSGVREYCKEHRVIGTPKGATSRRKNNLYHLKTSSSNEESPKTKTKHPFCISCSKNGIS